MSAAHTPGPWRYDYEPGYCGEIIASNGQTICTFADEPLPSNARLIAESPNLLELLKKYEIKFTDEKQARAEFGDFTVDRELLRRAAIAKAGGQGVNINV